MTPNTPPPPGSPEAVELSCKCPVSDNAHGSGYMGVAGVYVYSGDCPLHALKPQEWTTEDEHGRSKHRAGIL
jgi:hypothetical protein